MSKIWIKDYSLELINSIFTSNMTGFLDIKAIAIGDNFLQATMPVGDKVKQPFGILHGGASVVLAESVGSIASGLIIDPEKYMGVGMEVNANHLKSVSSGIVTATCTPFHIGSKTHVWDIKIHNEDQVLICISRLTVAIIAKQNP